MCVEKHQMSKQRRNDDSRHVRYAPVNFRVRACHCWLEDDNRPPATFEKTADAARCGCCFFSFHRLRHRCSTDFFARNSASINHVVATGGAGGRRGRSREPATDVWTYYARPDATCKPQPINATSARNSIRAPANGVSQRAEALPIF